MNNKTFIKNLKVLSTWKLVGLSIITLNIYYAHYIRNQTFIINDNINNSDNISETFATAFLVFSYTTVILGFINILIQSTIMDNIASLLNLLIVIMLITWGFKARNRLNKYCNFDKSNKYWFHGLWTFFLTPFYFNYKVNSIYNDTHNKLLEEERVSPAST